MKEIVFATNNGHKLEEVRSILQNAFNIKGLSDIGCFDDIPETGESFTENARQKSDYIVNNFGYNCFSDDSGLVVASLNNEPGVYSARYSGSRDMEANISLLLRRLEGKEDRSAAFVTVICLLLDGEAYFFEGRVNGTISKEKTGANGFGYDPVFIPDGYNKSFAEMTAEEKNSISHRAIAVRKLSEFLLKNFIG